MYRYFRGATTDYYNDESKVVTFQEVYDSISLDRIHHSAACSWCRRLWSTLQYRHSFAEDQVWAGLVSEFIKLLGSTGVQSMSSNLFAMFRLQSLIHF